MSEASVYRLKSGDRVHLVSWKTDFPFHMDAKSSHHWISRRASSVMGTVADSPDTVQLKSKSRRMNVLPGGGTTLAANDKCPIRDNSSRFEAELLDCHSFSKLSIEDSLSTGSLDSCASLSTSIPRTVMTVVGPTTLSSPVATGIPRLLKTCRVVAF